MGFKKVFIFYFRDLDHFYYGAGIFRDVDPGDWEPGKLPAHCRDVDRLYFGAGHLKMWIRALFGAGRLLGEKIYFVV